MRTHLQRTIPARPHRRSEASEPRVTSSTSTTDYSSLFKELFCVTAKDLAEQVHVPLEDIGVLHGVVMNTGTLSHTAKLKLRGLRLKKNALDAAERGESPVSFGRGQLLFVVRRASRSESSALQADGHRFVAMIPNVVDTLARSIEVTRDELLPTLENMRKESNDEHFLQPGVHLACLVLRSRPHGRLDVLVCKEANNMLPTKFLTGSLLEQWQLDILKGMNNLTVRTCCELLGAKSNLIGDRAYKFADELLEAITQLIVSVENPVQNPVKYFQEARLIAKPVRAPSPKKQTNEPQQEAFLITFRILTDPHDYISPKELFYFSSLKFFLCQQHAYKGYRDNEIFARLIYREFAAIAKLSHDFERRWSGISQGRSRDRSWDNSSFGSPRSRSASPLKKKSWPARVHFKGLDRCNGSGQHLVGLDLKQPYGAIHVSSDIEVDVSETQSGQSDIQMGDLRMCSEISAGEVEPVSFADELLAMTVDERKRMRI